MSFERSSQNSIYMSGDYLEKNPDWHVQDSLWKSKQIIQLLNRNEISPESIAEVGCGAGEILLQLSNMFPKASCVGYEISPDAFKLALNRSNERLRFVNESHLNDDLRYQVLLLIDVFEHVDDYLGFLRTIKQKSELQVFHIPLDISVQSILRNGMMKMRNNAGHLHYFSATTAIATLEYCGFTVLDHFFTKNFEGLPGGSWKAKLMKFPRKILFAVSPRLTVMLFGGCSLIVLTE